MKRNLRVFCLRGAKSFDQFNGRLALTLQIGHGGFEA
jgi:hypothetical protein